MRSHGQVRRSDRWNLWARDPDARADPPDARDLIYQPSLRPMRPRIDPRQDAGEGWWSTALVRDQADLPSCVGHAIAAATDILLERERLENGSKSPRPAFQAYGIPFASAIMLYGNARLHDEWPGERYAGTSLRGGLKAFQHNGVSSEVSAQLEWTRENLDDVAWRWHARREVQAEASETVLGSYRRVVTRLDDLHAAISEVGLVVATARVHDGWLAPQGGTIPFNPADSAGAHQRIRPMHAFVIIGFVEEGFLIQNSWGRGWGAEGTAVWRYDDWAANIFDAWVMKLAVRAPAAFRHSFGPQGLVAPSDSEHATLFRVTRLDVLGHFVPISNARLLDTGRFHADRRLVEQIAELIADEQDGRAPAPRHLLLYFMGGTRSLEEAARAVRVLHPIYRRHGIWPVFIPWETAMLEAVLREVRHVIGTVSEKVGARSVRDPRAPRLVESAVADVALKMRATVLGTIPAILANGVDGEASTPGDDLFGVLINALAPHHDAGRMSLHVAGHDIGAHLAAEFVGFAGASWGNTVFSSVHLVAPLLTREMLDRTILPILAWRDEGRVNRRARRKSPVVEHLRIYHLHQTVEAGDAFAQNYARSWPELWARAEAAAPGVFPHTVDRGDLRDGAAARTRILALSPYAEDAAKASRARLDAVPIGDPAPSATAHPTHFNLDASQQVVDEIIRTIVQGDRELPRRGLHKTARRSATREELS